MAIDLESALLRLCAIEKEALAALSPTVLSDAYPRFYFAGESFPYFTHRLGPMNVDADSEDFDIYVYDVVIRLVIGHITSGYAGENDEKLQEWLPQLVEYINERELLQSATYATELTALTRARVVSATGYAVFVNSAIGSTQQVGTEITVRLEFEEDITQAYL